VLFSVVPVVRKITVCCACALLLAPGATTALAAPADAPVPQATSTPAAASAPSADPGAELADFAEQYVGSPYRWGGASPSGFDCTGFVMWVYSQFGVSLPHNEAGQLASGDRVSADDLEPGDVLVFANTYRAGLSHTGIYVGDGQFVHAADERHGVTVSALWDGYWGPRLVGATRTLSS
jgi:cell wall-associated NlpC family hydrolase